MSAVLALVFQLYYNINAALSKTTIWKRKYSIWTATTLVAPYVLFVAIIVEVLIFGLTDPSTVQKIPEIAYCNMKNPIPGRVSAALVTLLIIPVIVIDVAICLLIRRNWGDFKSQKDTFSMFVRMCSFTSLAFLSALSGVLFFFVVLLGHSKAGTEILNLMLAIVPVTAIITFGTHKDLLGVWLFWRRKNSQDTESTDCGLEHTTAGVRTDNQLDLEEVMVISRFDIEHRSAMHSATTLVENEEMKK